MGEGPPGGNPPGTLLVWCLATFHAALLVSLLVGGLYLADVAGDVLAGLETAVGVASYLYLWAVTWWTNRRWLERVGPAVASGRPALRPAVGEAVKWGGFTGLLFFAGLLVVGGGVVIFTTPGAVLLVALAGLVGVVASFAVGAAVGALFAAVDVLLARAATMAWPDGDVGAPSPGS